MLRPLAFAAAITGLAAVASAQSYPWTTLSPTTSPTARERVGSATDGTVLYLYGGQNGTTTNGYDNLLSFDGTDWTELTASGAGCGPRANPAMAWDSARGKLVVFGGKGDAASWNNRLQDTWEWDSVNGWVQMSPATVPDLRWFANAVYVPGVGVVFHGGNCDDGTGTVYTDNQTWAWNGTDWSVIATGPAKENYTLVYRPAAHDLILFGGISQTSTTKSDETWQLDLTAMTWSQIATTTLPTSSAATGGPGLVGATGYLNPNTGNFILHGGQGNGGAPSTFTWEFDGVDWTDISYAGTVNIRNAPGQWLAATQRGYALCGNSSNSAKNWTQKHGPVGSGTFFVAGAGCPTSVGLTAGLSAQGIPIIGQNFVVDMTNGTPGTIPVALLGISDTTWGAIPLPLGFSLIFPSTPLGCDLLVSIDQALGMAATPTGATVTLPIPNKPQFVGVSFYIQALQLELVSGVFLRVNTSPYGTATIGT